jgi:Trypsin-co-occurring domain 2
LAIQLISQGEGMKGQISLRDFIKEVRAELEQAKAEESDAFFELQEVTLEVAFSLDISGKGAGKFIVVDLSGEAKASQSHKVVLKLQPYSGDAAPAVRVPSTSRTAAQSSGIAIDSPLGPYLNLIRQRPGGRFLLGDVAPTFTSDLILSKSPWLPDSDQD